MGIRWHKEESRYLIDNYHKLSSSDLKHELQSISGIVRSIGAIQLRAGRMGLKTGFYWTEEEELQLSLMCGEYPFGQLLTKYNRWAEENSFRPRNRSAVIDKLRKLGGQITLDNSTVNCTVSDLQALLGCANDTARRCFIKYAKELKVKSKSSDETREKNNSKQYCSYFALKKWFKNHPEIAEQYRNTIDLQWLIFILTK